MVHLGKFAGEDPPVLAENAHPLENCDQLIRCCAGTVGGSVGYGDQNRGRSEDAADHRWPRTSWLWSDSWSGLGRSLFPAIASGRLVPHLPQLEKQWTVLAFEFPWGLFRQAQQSYMPSTSIQRWEVDCDVTEGAIPVTPGVTCWIWPSREGHLLEWVRRRRAPHAVPPLLHDCRSHKGLLDERLSLSVVCIARFNAPKKAPSTVSRSHRMEFPVFRVPR